MLLDRREKEDVDELIELMVEILMMPDDSVVRIGGADKPVSVVQKPFLKLTYSHIEYVFVQPAPEYIQSGEHQGISLTTLYNSSMTMNHYYQAEVNHDLYGGK